MFVISDFDSEDRGIDTIGHGDVEPEASAAMAFLKKWLSRPSAGLLCVSLAAALLTAIFVPFLDERRLPDVAMLYIVLTLVSAATWGYAVGLFSALLTNVLLNYFFIPPVHKFTVADRGNAGGLVLFFLVALLAAGFVSRFRSTTGRLRSALAENATLLKIGQAVAGASADMAPSVFCASAARGLAALRVEIVESRDGWVVLAGSPRTGQRLGESESLAATEAWERTESRAPTFKGQGETMFIPLPPRTAPPAVLLMAGMMEPPVCVDLDRFFSALAAEARVAVRLGVIEA